ncbi:MAG: ATP-binding cassette domain-containing protein [Propionibacterium acidifaciens]|uniref:ATP-binding cassette domain-containing protein n=1 Tax=Propionibacterium acidifaciens TaxID=556499 RepID=UPI003621ECED
MGVGVRIRGLSMRRGDFVLRVPELDVLPDEVLAILGRTGSGKTVLMEAIAGAFPLDEGTIEFDGRDARTLPVQDRAIGMLYQDYLLFPHLTVRDNVAYGPRRAGAGRREARARAMELLTALGVARLADSMPAVISGGEQQRVALARALAARPGLLLLDEPFSALDPTTRAGLYETLRDVRRAFDCTIILVTHDFGEAQLLADRVGVMLEGRLRTVVAADALLDRAGHEPEVARFLGIDDDAGEDIAGDDTEREQP